MKYWGIGFVWMVLCGCAHAATAVWQPADGHTQIPLWAGKPPDAQPMPGPETMKVSTDLIAGRPATSIRNVSVPTLTVYAPKGDNTGAAVLVIPGGGFEILAIDLEGTEVCDWLVVKGITCVLLKYRVPSAPYDWHTNTRPHNLQVPVESLEDVQRAVRLVRAHALEWHINPHKLGVLGFSAGGYLVAQISTNFNKALYAPADAADKLSARPDFAVAVYPGHLSNEEYEFNDNVPVSNQTPPTFLLQAEDDTVDGVQQSLVYFRALKEADVPVEMHLYAHGGHAFGLRPSQFPISRWPQLVDVWLHTIGIVEH